MSDKKNITAATKIDSELDGRLRAAARKACLDKSEFIRRAVEHLIAEYEEDQNEDIVSIICAAMEKAQSETDERLLEIKAALAVLVRLENERQGVKR